MFKANNPGARSRVPKRCATWIVNSTGGRWFLNPTFAGRIAWISMVENVDSLWESPVDTCLTKIAHEPHNRICLPELGWKPRPAPRQGGMVVSRSEHVHRCHTAPVHHLRRIDNDQRRYRSAASEAGRWTKWMVIASSIA